jgi:hypothetical protein
MASRSLPANGSVAKLRARQRELAQRVAELTWDLGGLTYEMAIRDHYRLDVLARRAAELQEADAQLGEVQRLLASSEAGVHGQCSSCGAVHSRGAAYCWQCGAPLLSEGRPAALSAGVSGAGPVNGTGSVSGAASVNGAAAGHDAFGAGRG